MKRRIITLGILTAAATTGALAWFDEDSADTHQREATERHAQENTQFVALVQDERNPLRRRIADAVHERGVLETANSAELLCRVEGGSTIIEIVQDGTAVKQGDVVVRLDDSKHRSDLNEAQILQARAQADVERTAAAMKLRNLLAEQEVNAARQRVHVAELQKAAEDAEADLEAKSLKRELALAGLRLQAAEKRLKQDKDLERVGKDATAARIAVEETRAEVQAASDRLALLAGAASEFRDARHKLEIAVGKAELAKTQSESKAEIASTEAEFSANKAAVELAAARVKRLERQVQNCTIAAPTDGLVVLANLATRRTASDQIESGATVRERQVICTIADMQKLQVRVKVHESKIKRVKKGQPATIRFDAAPRRSFQGTVLEVARRPSPGTWPNTDVVEYDVVVSLEQPDPGLKLGLTAAVEIDVSE